MTGVNLRSQKKTKKTRLKESLRENLKKRKVQARNRLANNKVSSDVNLKKD